MAQQLPSQPVAFVVTLEAGSGEAEAQVIRSAIRAFAHVATVSPVGSSPALTAAQERARAETEAAWTPVWHELVADMKARAEALQERMEAATEEMSGILQAAPDGTPAWQSEVARTPSRNGNGHAGNGHEPGRNGRVVPPQGRSQHAARVPPRAAQRP